MKKKRNYKKIKIIVGVAAILIVLLAITVQARGITFEQLTSYIESLTSDRKIQDVIEKIDNIGEVEYTETCLSKIVIAENAYNDLTSEQKQKVTNYDKLVLARKTYEILAADNLDTTSLVKKDSGEVENVKWYVYENGLLEITGEGQIPDYSTTNLAPWHNYKDMITKILVRSSVTKIGSFAFYGCNNVTEMTIPFIGQSRTATLEKSAFGYIFGYSKYTTNSTSGTKIYDVNGNTTYISSSGNNGFVNCYVEKSTMTQSTEASNCPWYTCRSGGTIHSYLYKDTIPSTLKKVTITDASTIPDGAFNKCRNITEIIINDGVTQIGKCAFQHNTSLTEFIIPENVTNIGEYAFYGCSSLLEIKLPDNIQKINRYTFSECTNLKNVKISKSVTIIDVCAFSKCSNLTNIIIPNSVENIGIYAFSECTNLNNVNIGESVKTIGNNAFEKCTSLKNIIIPNNVQTIGASSFNGCNALTEITLPFIGESRTATLEKSAFGYIFGCSKNNKSYDSGATFFNAKGEKTNISSEGDGFVNCYVDIVSSTYITTSSDAKEPWYSYKLGSTIYSYLYKNTIPSSLKKVTITDASIIQDGAFNNCKNITEININDGVTSIGYSFQNVPWYTNLSDEFVIKGNNVLIKYNGEKSSVTIPENVTCISGGVFENNTNISEVILPNNLKEIGWHCFNGCTNLTSIIIPKSVTKIGSLAIPNTCKIKVYRPSAGYDYRATNREIINNSETIGNDTYYYNIEENGNAEIIGCDTTSTELTIPSKLGEYTIDKIGDYGIANCTTIKSVTIPSEINTIGNYAFYKCTSLVNATIPPTVKEVGEYAFKDCTGLVNVTISEGVELLGKGTFYNCTSLIEAVVPDTVEKLGEYAFYNCKAMAKATIGTKADAINKYTFYDCNELESVVIGTKVTYIDDYAFYNCALTRVTVPSTVTKIGEFAFEKCNALERATLRKNLLTIGKGAFKDCEKLATISIPTTVTEIGSSAFENCSSIPAITIPEGLTNIDDRVFSNCSSLATVTINSKLTSIGTASFYNCAISEIALPDTLEIIKSLAFAKCKNLKQITIPSATLEIGDSAFSNCTSLEMVSVADKVEKIGKGTFFKNNDLTINVRYEEGILADNLFEKQDMSHIVLDENITKIGNKAFAECYNLNDITYGEEKAEDGKYLFSKNIQTIGQEAFKDNGKLRNFVVPDTIKTIGQNAFYNNVKNKHNCKDITVTFYYVEGAIEENILKSQNVWNIILEDNIHSIGNSAFANCSVLETISIPDTITSVGDDVFKSSGNKLVATFRGVDGTIDDSIYKNKTKGINSIYIDENVKTIGKYAFAENDDIQQVAITKADTIDENAFENDVQIKTLTIDSVKNINNYAFHNCNSINKITIDKDLINIGDHAFDSCKHIPEVVLPNTVRKIGVAAFYDCNSMKSINIPNGIDKINNQTFFGCANLLKVDLPDTVKSIGEEAYYGCVLINNLKVGNNLEEIKQKAFYNCNEVKKLELPTTLKSIGDYAFRACKFEKISIPDSVETIGECVFYGCTELKEADFGNQITSIGNSVFYGCVNLTKLILNGTVTSIHELAFYGAEDTEIYSHENDYVKNYCDEQGLVFHELIDEFTMSLKEPNKKEYIEFEELDLTGLELLISFSDGTTRTVTTGYNLSGYNSEKIGTQTITVEYKGKTETFDVTVVEKKVVSLNCKETNKLTITTGQELDLSNVKIIATYNDGETKELKNGYSINNFDNKQIGTQNVTISYRGIDTNILVEVVDYIPGDINGDGIVSMKDVTRLNNYLNDNQTKVIKAALDVNGDGVVSIKDITRLVEYLSDNTVEIH